MGISSIDWNALASLATAAGFGVAARQLRDSKSLRQAQFEDSYNKQYRGLCYAIPVDALLGKTLKKRERSKAREVIYNYLDLCNEQLYQRSRKRISNQCWKEWQVGIKENLMRPCFKDVWLEVKKATPHSLSYWEKFECSGFAYDPSYKSGCTSCCDQHLYVLV